MYVNTLQHIHTLLVEFTPPAGIPGGSCTLSTHLCDIHCSGSHPQLCQSKFKISLHRQCALCVHVKHYMDHVYYTHKYAFIYSSI